MKFIEKLVRVSQVVMLSTISFNFAFAVGLKSADDPNLRRASPGYEVSAEQAKAVLNSAPLVSQPPSPAPSPSVPQMQSPLFVGTAEPDNDDVGSEDDLESIEGNSVCLEPECLSDYDFEVFKGSQKEDLNIVSAAVIQKAFEKYSKSEEIRNLINKARENVRTRPGRYIQRVGKKVKAFCYRAVKDALRESGMVSKVFQGSAHAYQGVQDLKPLGFDNLMDDVNIRNILQYNPRLAPKGAILVFETAPGARVSPSGHIEIKTQDSGIDGYISISESSRPTYGYRIPQQRRLVGVLYKRDIADL